VLVVGVVEVGVVMMLVMMVVMVVGMFASGSI